MGKSGLKPGVNLIKKEFNLKGIIFNLLESFSSQELRLRISSIKICSNFFLIKTFTVFFTIPFFLREATKKLANTLAKRRCDNNKKSPFYKT